MDQNTTQPQANQGAAVLVGSGTLLGVRGFWRSPSGENHGRDSRPGDIWFEPGDITDTDRINWLMQQAQPGRERYAVEAKGFHFSWYAVKHGDIRAAIDAAMDDEGRLDD